MSDKLIDRASILTDPDVAMRAYADVDVVAFDLETNSLDRHTAEAMVISMAAPGLPPVVLHPAGYITPELIDFLSTKILLGHNLVAYDLPVLHKYGYDVLTAPLPIDTMIVEQLCLTSGRRDVKKNLAATVKRRTGKVLNKDVDHAGWGNAELTDEQISYSAGDVTLLHRTYAAQTKRLEELKLAETLANERRAHRATSAMIIRGLPVVLDEVATFVDNVKADMIVAQANLDAVAGQKFNLRSPKQVKDFFLKRFGLALPSTDAETLDKLAYAGGAVGDAAAEIVRFRGLAKAAMYDDEWVAKNVSADGRMRSSYWQMGTDTSRYSCSGPNLQQWPRAIRGFIGHKEGAGRVILSTDYSQIEILIASILCHEPQLMAAVLGSDVHTYVASMVFGLPIDQVDKEHRKLGKAASFTLLFAGGAPGIIRSAGGSGTHVSTGDAQQVKAKFYAAFPGVAKYIHNIQNNVAWRRENGMSQTVRVPGGPVRTLFGETLTPSTVVNTLVQGAAAVGLKRALSLICERGMGQYLAATVHDEIILDVPDSEVEEVKKEVEECMKTGMEQIIGVRPRVESSVGLRWS